MPSFPTKAGTLRSEHVQDHPQSWNRPLRIIHVGMGASGLLFAYKARQLKNYELVCYERHSTFGGTWLENKYPGCACDIPAHTYTYPFYPHAEWSGYYSYSNEIQDYFKKFAKEHDVEKYGVFNTEVLSCAWIEERGEWLIRLRRGSDGHEFEDSCSVLVNGSGIFSRWKWPEITNLHDFKGELAHSANWPESLYWQGKRVAVIGSGSSSIQMVAQFADTAEKVTVFIRNKTYIGPQIGSSVTNKDADPDSMDPQAAGKHHYTEKEKQRFRDDREYHLEYRRRVESAVVSGFSIFYRGSEANLTAKSTLQQAMAQQLGDRDDLKSRFNPDWSPGCRRLTPGEGYLYALTRPNVSPVFTGISHVTPNGIVTTDGIETEFDIIACATGFKISYHPHFPISGIQGQMMQNSEPNLYASIASPGFPNYFVVNGPRGNWGQGCALPSHEVQIAYIIQCCRKLQDDSIKYLTPKLHITNQMNAYMDAWHSKHSVWAEECRSWYKDNVPDGRVQIWPGSLLHHLKFLKRPRYEHFDVVYTNPDNVFAFLGNGLTITEENAIRDQRSVPVPYIRNREDDPWEID